jgi:hypothetical protein
MAGLLSNFKNPFGSGGLLSDPETRLMMGAAMMSGQNFGESIGNGLGVAGQMKAASRQKQADAEKQNKTLEFLRKFSPDLAGAVEAGALSPTDAYKQHLESQKPQKIDYQEVGGQLFNPQNGQWIAPPVNPNAKSVVDEYGVTPQYGVDANGKPVLLQLSKSGKVSQPTLPNGVTLDRSWLDAQKAQGHETGKFQGSHEATAPQDVQSADMALKLIDEIKTNSYLDRGVGMTSLGNSIPGTGGYDFQNIVDQAKSGAFLTAIQQMRGLGTLSDAEGKSATAAIARLDTATSKEAFLKALDDYQTIIEQGKSRAQGYMPSGQPQGQPMQQLPQGMGGKTSSGLSWSLGD